MKASLTLGFVGLLGAAGTGFGEYLLHYSATEYANPAPYHFFTSISSGRVMFGHFVSVAFLPLYVGGYTYLYQILAGGNILLRRTFFATGVYGLFVGGIWLGGRAALHAVANAAATDPSQTLVQLLERLAYLNESLITVTRLAIFFSSLCFVALALGGKTILPKWVAVVNPIGLVLFALALFLWVPAIGNHVMPVAMNFAHVVLFAVILFLQIREEKILNELAKGIK